MGANNVYLRPAVSMLARGLAGGPAAKKAFTGILYSSVRLLKIFVLAVAPLSAPPAWAADDALTAAEIRALIVNMDDAGHPPQVCGTPTSMSEPLCSMKQSGRKRCLALKEKILAASGDFVVPPVIQTDKYDQKDFDQYAGKCRGTEFNKTYAEIEFWMTAESNKGLRLYVVKAFDPARNDLVIFGRNYGMALEPYQKREMEKEAAEGKHFEPTRGSSLFSRLDRKDCRIREFQGVAEPGPLSPGSPHFVEYDKVSIIHVGTQYYIADHHKYNDDEKDTLRIFSIQNGFAHSMGGADYCDFQ